MRFGADVVDAAWSDEAQAYTVRLRCGEELTFDVLISAIGLLSNPNRPDWPGLEEFAGPKFHTAEWEHEHDLHGKRVAVVGTGSTGCQLVPELAEVAGRVTHFQRSPTWIVPKGDREFNPFERRLFKRFLMLQRISRLRIFRSIEGRKFRQGVRKVESAQQQEWREACIKFIVHQIEDPEIRKAVTPQYPVGCKRLVFSSLYYKSLNRPNVKLVPSGVQRVTPSGIVDSDGVEHPTDVIVMATGFTPQKFLSSLEVFGRGGRTIHEVWDEDRPTALAGMTVPDFPNFFILYGPNTNGGVSTMAQSQRQAEAIVRTLNRMARHGASSFDTRPAVLERYVQWIDRMNSRRTATSPELCSNYYFDEQGRNVTQWPSTHKIYRLALRLILPVGLKLSRAGAASRQRLGHATPEESAAHEPAAQIPVGITI
jgi:cation diffusion facilitator CzcD-associated flavoprotein CzcO